MESISSNETYIGVVWFDRRCAKTGRSKKASEHVRMKYPPINDQSIFAR